MSSSNPSQQLRLLFLSSVIVLFVGMGLFPVLPLYAAQLGASRTTIGLLFSLMYAANSAGPLAVGWLSPRLGHRRLFIATALLSLPTVLLAGRVTALWQLMLLTAILWFSGGLLVTLASVWTVTLVARQRRGASFSLLSLANPLGAVLGGFAVGLLLKWSNYAVMFGALTIVWAGLLVIGLLLRAPRAAALPQTMAVSPAPARFGRRFGWLLGLTLLSTIGISVTQLGRSLSMQALDISASLVASTATVGGLVAIPATLLLGGLSDRLGRARLLAGAMALAGLAALILMNAAEAWHFWLAAALSFTAQSATRGLSTALASDLLAPESLSRGLPLVNLVNGVGGALSFAATGLVMETLSQGVAYLSAAALVAVTVVELRRLVCPPRVPVVLAGDPAAQSASISC